MKLGSGGLVLVAVLLGSEPARAVPPVSLSFEDGVAERMRDDVRHLVELELRTHLVERPAADTTVVHLRAVPDRASRVRLIVEDPVTGKLSERSVDVLALGPSGATRLLAIAVVELLTASWAELATNPRPVARAVEATAIEEQSAALATVVRRAPPTRRTQVSALGLVDGTFKGAGALGGGGVRLVHELPRQLALVGDLAGVHGSRSFDAGDVTIDALSADVLLAYRGQWSRFGVRAGAGGKVGAVRYGGQARSDLTTASNAFWAPLGGVVASVSGLVQPTPRLVLELVLQGGYTFSSTTAGVAGTSEVSVAGPFVSGALGVGFFAGR